MSVQNQVNPDYASMVFALDVNVGRIIDVLKDQGLEDNTIVIFTSDNGGLTTLGRNRTAPTSVAPLRAGKGWCYEGGIRIPLIFKAPNIEPSVENYPVISMDLYPTVLELSALPMAPEQHVDGLSLEPLLRGDGEFIREDLFWHFPHYHGSTWKPGSAIRSGDWKLIYFYEEEVYELYNLNSDIEEQNDLSEENPEKLEELRLKLFEMLENTNSQFPTSNPDYNKS